MKMNLSCLVNPMGNLFFKKKIPNGKSVNLEMKLPPCKNAIHISGFDIDSYDMHQEVNEKHVIKNVRRKDRRVNESIRACTICVRAPGSELPRK